MTRTVIFIAVLLMLAPDEIKKKTTHMHRRSEELKERFWRRYDAAAVRTLDELERLGVIRQKDYGSNP